MQCPFDLKAGELYMDGERISLRLEPEDLALLDDFIQEHPEYSNRSNLARTAIRQFIEGAEGAGTAGAKPATANVVEVRIPPLALKAMENSVRAGVYNSAEEAIVECVRARWIKPDAVEKVKSEALEAISETVQQV